MIKKKIELTDQHKEVNKLLSDARNKNVGAILLGLSADGKLNITATTNNVVEVLGILDLAAFEVNMGMFIQNQQKANTIES